MRQTAKLMTELIRESIDSDYRASIDEQLLSSEIMSELYKVSEAHDVAHMVAHALENRGALKNDILGNAFRRSIMIAVFRHEGQIHEIERICSTLESAKIPFILLKGSELCYLYPEPWMRARSDIDVLVKPDDINVASAVICQELGYVPYNDTGTNHDVSLISDGGVHVELHYTLWDDDINNAAGSKAAAVLERVWEHASPGDSNGYRYKMDDELFCLYHYVHMAKHVLNGGCGVKPFIDLAVMKRGTDKLSPSFYALAKECAMDVFVSRADQMTEVWFNNETHDSTSLAFEQYILCGGVYGSYKNRLSVGRIKKNGRLGYILSRVFLPYKELKYRYSVLQKHPWLLPVFEVVRWFSLIFGGKTSRVAAQLKIDSEISDEQVQATRVLINKLGL